MLSWHNIQFKSNGTKTNQTAQKFRNVIKFEEYDRMDVVLPNKAFTVYGFLLPLAPKSEITFFCAISLSWFDFKVRNEIDAIVHAPTDHRINLTLTQLD